LTEKLIAYGLPIVALLVFASATGIPTGMPIKIVLLLAGAYLIGSLPGLTLAIAVAATAELAGTVVLHGIARTGGTRLLDRMAAERQASVHATFNRWRSRVGGHDVAAIAILRLIPVVRMGVAVGSGLMGIRLRDFVFGSAIAALIWTAVPLSLGYAFRARLEEVEAIYGGATDALPAILGIAVLLVVVTMVLKTRATQAKLRESLALFSRPFRARATSFPEVGQESPPGLG
jgi:membrane protein DedA with SNARE-associated domain